MAKSTSDGGDNCLGEDARSTKFDGNNYVEVHTEIGTVLCTRAPKYSAGLTRDFMMQVTGAAQKAGYGVTVK